MFESAEIGHRISKAEYARQEPLLREALLKVQFELLADASFPVVILIAGVDGAGKGETVNLLNEWMDPRHIVTHAFGKPTDEESQRPPMWRFWRALPPKGRIGVLFGSWYSEPILARVKRRISASDLVERIEQIRHFERMLVSEGALVLKFWFHLSHDQQKRRLKALSEDPKTRWRVTEADWNHFEQYDRFRKVSELTLRETSTGDAPWSIVEGTDPSVIPIAAPTQEDRAHPYLWRFWRHLPLKNRVTIFDRSWCGRVLVERFEGFAAEADWMRAYHEINAFEEQLVDNGAYWSSSGWRSLRTSNSSASTREQRRHSRASRSPRTTGETATAGSTTSTRSATWSSVAAQESHPGT